ncbi:Actin-crosslinking [Arabidopsis thaliana x Arabidopsis arenosa]|uniref:Actin-crosslinking n=1 Tax=Arabidopsis thaliana x Arabidopsis arenosa TaxID=1240361 RepID=A0A8T2BGK9_9BRAS|nr:Actin-crosslinking [Arabidopsis thaliana x Arabidopsis arenosa]
MELFNKGTAVRLRSCHEKYIFAVDDEKTVRQSSDGTSRQSLWTVEMVPRKPKFIRLKSCYGKYLTASESSFLLGMTGAKVIQTPPFRQAEHESDWEPIREESTVKLMSWNEKYLRGNGGAPPWKNSVTCDREPHISATKKWILWSVELVENPDKVLFADRFSSPASSFNSSVSDGSNHGSPVQKLPTFGSSESIGSDPGSLASVSSSKLMFTPSRSGTLSPKPTERKSSKKITVENVSAMEIFRDAKSVRLRSTAHDKYMTADDDEESVVMGRNGSSKEARWRVEMVPGSEKAIRLKSCHGGYLTASNERFLLGATGHKVVQSRRIRVGEPAGEWEPVKEGSNVKLRSRNGGNYLRANGGVPPWRNTVTHDSPNRSVTQSWVVWDVDVVDIHGNG